MRHNDATAGPSEVVRVNLGTMRFPAGSLLEFMRTFPSVSHQLLWQGLEVMRVPLGLRHIVRGPYKGVTSAFVGAGVPMD